MDRIEVGKIMKLRDEQLERMGVAKGQDSEASSQRRKKIWQIHTGYHCSVIGACLSRKDLKQIAKKKVFGFEQGLSSFAIHRSLSAIASERLPKTRALNKILDGKYKGAVKKYSSLANDEEVRKEWKKDLKTGGAIPGAFWAVMTLPSCSKTLLDEVYGDCHMVSYDIFASYTNDARLTAGLKKKIERLECSLERSQATSRKEKELRAADLKELQQSREELKRQLQIGERLAAENGELREKIERQDGVADLESLQKELAKQKEENRLLLEAIEQDLEKAEIDREVYEAELVELKTTNAQLQEELVSLEGMFQLGMGGKATCDTCQEKEVSCCQGVGLSGKAVLYVGGRSNMIAHYREMVEKYGGIFLHHDGGKESSRNLLPKMLSGADAVLCPIDCISHDACKCVKKICKRNSKPFVMMRSAGLSSLAKGLETIIQ
ncbi:MAG: hypothetical protein CSA20_04160 [Deltaproteobacteria bacterium]|nr:MAG: hypothetical protein CSA20_04160 [Deltaproteobacteria bacterium]